MWETMVQLDTFGWRDPLGEASEIVFKLVRAKSLITLRGQQRA